MTKDQPRKIIAVLVVLFVLILIIKLFSFPRNDNNATDSTATNKFESRTHGFKMNYPMRFNAIDENSSGVSFKTNDPDNLDGIHIRIDLTETTNAETWLSSKQSGTTDNEGFTLFALVDDGALVKEYYVYEQNPETGRPVFAFRVWGMKWGYGKTYMMLIDRDLLGDHVPRLNKEIMDAFYSINIQ